MKLEYKMGGKTYLPPRAVGAITSGCMYGSRLSDAIVNYENWCDADYNEVITPLTWSPPKQLLAGDRDRFQQFSACDTTDPLFRGRQLPPGLLVTKSSVKEKVDILVQRIGRRHPLRVPYETTIWNSSPKLSSLDRTFVLEGLPPSSLELSRTIAYSDP